jgi:type 1 glutamine amidotransferase
MKRFLSLAILCLFGLATLAGAQQPGNAAKKGKGKRNGQLIRVLLTVGGHAFNQKEFYAMWDSFKGIKYDKLTCPAELDKLKPGLEKQYDVIVFYDQMKNLKPEQQKNLVDLIKGGVGVFSLHHNIGANSGWDEWANIIGALYVRSPRVIDGVQYTKAVSVDDQTFQIQVADPKHDITKGIKDFQIVDEAYDKYYLDPRVHVILSTVHPKNAKSVAWVTTYGKSPVFYLQLGHGPTAYNNPNFRRLVQNGIRWAAKEHKAMAAGATPEVKKQ